MNMLRNTIACATLAAGALSGTACGDAADYPKLTDGCLRDSECDTGLTCFERVCANRQWAHVAVVSLATDDIDLFDTDAPGPDMDAVDLRQDGTMTFAATIEQFVTGEPLVTNEIARVTAVLDENDSVPYNNRDCALGPSGGLYAMGDASGFVVVSFGALRLQEGDVIRVWEADEVICDNIRTGQTDPYAVYIGRASADVAGIRRVGDLGSDDWILLGEATAGGIAEFTVELPSP